MLLNELGLDPGLDHLLAIELLRRIRTETKGEATIVAVESSCGALPRLDSALTSPFLYKFSWSSAGVLRAVLRSASIVEDGTVHTVDSPYDHAYPVNVCGLALQSVANEDSSKYITTYLGGNTKGSIRRNTLRLDGSIPAFLALRDAGFLENSTKLLITALSPLALTKHCLSQSATKLLPTLSALLESSGFFATTPVIDATGLTALDATARFLGTRYGMTKEDRDMTVMHIKVKYYMQHAASTDTPQTRTVSLVEFGDHRNTSVARLVGQCVAAAAVSFLDGTLNGTLYAGVQRPLDSTMAAAILKAMRPARNLRSMVFK